MNPDRLSRWRGPHDWYTSVALMVLAAALRLPNLGWPRSFVFDETYYAKEAFSLLKFGNEQAFAKTANGSLLAGDLNVFTGAAAFVVHPPLGKWMIALGELVFGVNPFGWRIMAVVVGVAMVALVHRIALRLFSNAWAAAMAGLFMAIDGMAIVLSRTAMLDQFLTFWILCTFYALVRDRDEYRHTLALLAYGEPVPRLRWARPWRLVAVVCIAAAFATKWSALWFAIGFAALALAWDNRERRVHPDVAPGAWLHDVAWLAIATVLGVMTYIASWIGWFTSDNGYDRSAKSNTWASWLEYHRAALGFHTHLTSDHPYKADPYWWPLQVRPTSFWFETYANGTSGCAAQKCAAEVVALGNPLLWWLASASVIVLLAMYVWRVGQRIDWWALAAPMIGIAAGWLPWIYFHERTTFTFYSIVFAPFMFMVLAYALSLMPTRVVVLDGEELSVTVEEVDRRRYALVVVLVLVIVAASVFFYPVWVGTVQPYDAWHLRMWFPSWI